MNFTIPTIYNDHPMVGPSATRVEFSTNVYNRASILSSLNFRKSALLRSVTNFMYI